MDKPKLEELKIGDYIWLDRQWVGKSENWGRKYRDKSKFARGTITQIEGTLITIGNENWNYFYTIEYNKDVFGKDWFIVRR